MRRGVVAGVVALVAAGSIALGSSVVSASALAGDVEARAVVTASGGCGTWRGDCPGYVDEDLDGVCDNRDDSYCDGAGCGYCDNTGYSACDNTGCSACDGTGCSYCDGTGCGTGPGSARCGQNGRGGHRGARNCW